MSTSTDHSDPRVESLDGETCRGRGGDCDRPTQAGDLCYRCIYDEQLLEDPTICPRCFRRTHTIELVSSTNRRRAAGGDLDWTIEDGVWKLEGELYFRTPETERPYPPPRDDERPEARTVCPCGDIDGARRDTLSREHALEHARRLSERLDEVGFEHDPETLLDVVDDLKHEPETAGKDQPVFRRAVAAALEATDG